MMHIKKAACIGGPPVNYSVINENTIRILDETYFFDPSCIEFDNIPSPIPEILFIAYDIFRDDSGELHLTLFQGEPV